MQRDTACAYELNAEIWVTGLVSRVTRPLTSTITQGLLTFAIMQTAVCYAMNNLVIGVNMRLIYMYSVTQVEPVIKSYSIQDLIKPYRKGSRQWLFNEVAAWLGKNVYVGDADLLPQQPQLPDAQSARPVFLMLADAGMGKSVFSAVMATMLDVRAKTEPSMVMVSWGWSIKC